MKTNNHTLGPWQLAPCNMIESANGNYICKIDATEGREHHANARLIAAAPQLLEALRNVLSSAEWALMVMPDIPDPSEFRSSIAEARAAIALATGNEVMK